MPTIDTALVRRLIAAQFPQWADLEVRPVDAQGWDNRTFRLGDALAVRLPSAAPYAAQVETEQAWLPRLAPHLPLRIPEPIAQGAPGQGYSWPWSVYAWLPGVPVTIAASADMAALAARLAGFLTALQAIDTAGGPAPGARNFHRGGDLAVYDGETRAALSALEGRIDTDAAGGVWDVALSARFAGPPVWVHGDIAPGNLLVAHGRLGAVIDFGCMAVGDPACDLQIIWTFFGHDAGAIFRARMVADGAMWARARGWALWKALILLAGRSRTTAPEWQTPGAVLDAVIADAQAAR